MIIKNRRKSLIFRSKFIFFILMIQNHRFCCSQCMDEAKNVAKSFIFMKNSLKNSIYFKEKNMFSRIPVYRCCPQKSLVFHSKCVILMQNPRFHRCRYIDAWKIVHLYSKCDEKTLFFMKNELLAFSWKIDDSMIKIVVCLLKNR